MARRVASLIRTVGRLWSRRGLALAGVALCLATAWTSATQAAGRPQAQATEWVQLHAGSRMRLVALPGPTVLAGIELELSEGWKTYWRMPGEAGVPPQFDWQGSGNLASVEVLYPAPERLVDPAAESIGYKHAVMFPVKIRAGKPGEAVTLKLEAEFGLCKDICVPIQTTLQLPVPPSPQAADIPAALKSALEGVPRPMAERRSSDPAIVHMAAMLDGPAPRLVIDTLFAAGDKGADLFVEAPDSLFVPLPKAPAKTGNAALRFEIPLTASTAQDLRGKSLKITLVSATGAVEAQWRLP